MTTQVATISATPDLEIIEGQITTTSQQVAAHFSKGHNLVLRAIRNLECSDDFRLRNFAQSSYRNEQGKEQPCYRLTRDGFVFLAMGFTGKEAAQWKEAYITAFNKMEQELLAQTTRPHNPAIDYDRISPAQAQDLKELVHTIVDAKVQGFGETWARLHKKFRVNSYLELPATQFEAARDYLLGKLPAEAIAIPTPVQAGRASAAFAMATEAVQGVQRAVFDCVMAGESEKLWQHRRYMVCLSYNGSTNKYDAPWCGPLEFDAVTMTVPEMARRLRNEGHGEWFPVEVELAELGAAIAQRQAHVAQRRYADLRNAKVTAR